MNTYTFLANLVYSVLNAGYGFIISGYNNDTNEDKTDDLAAEISRIYSTQPEFNQPVIFPLYGVWQGTKERSLLVLFPSVISTNNPVVTALMCTVRLLTDKYSQYETIVINGGRFQIYNRPNNTVSFLGDVAHKLTPQGKVPQGYSEVFFDQAREHFITAFEIRTSEIAQLELEATQHALDIPKAA